ncbi:MAG: glycosyltransferase family 39 protein [bacterium]|nr:glycosyltransferase family 39 protein [bacterium]
MSGKKSPAPAISKNKADKPEDIWQIYFVQLILLTTILRLLFAALAELKYEEAYYWCYGAHLNLSYFDHPPLTGWLIYLFTYFGGQSELMVRLPAIILFTGLLGIIFKLTSQMFSSKTAFITCAIMSCLPAFAWYSMMMLPDAPLLFFWTVGLMYGYKIIKEENTYAWWAVGIATGLGMLSKYPALLIPLAPILYIVFAKRWKLLQNIHFAGSLLAAAVIFSPVLYWNAQHEWCSFIFQGISRFHDAKTTDFANRFGGTWLNQLLILSPGGFILIIWALVKAWQRRAETAVRYLLCSALPFLGLIALVSCLRLVQMNWALPGYLAAAIIAGAELERCQMWAKRKWLAVLIFTPAILISLLPLAGTLFPLGALNRANDFRGWKEVAKAIAQDVGRMPNPNAVFIAGTGYQISAELAYYMQQPELVYSSNLWGLDKDAKGFAYWSDPRNLIGCDAIIVTYDELRSDGQWHQRGDFEEEPCRRHFESLVKSENFTVYYGGKPLRRYRIYLAHNYKGLQNTQSE